MDTIDKEIDHSQQTQSHNRQRDKNNTDTQRHNRSREITHATDEQIDKDITTDREIDTWI